MNNRGILLSQVIRTYQKVIHTEIKIYDYVMFFELLHDAADGVSKRKILRGRVVKIINTTNKDTVFTMESSKKVWDVKCHSNLSWYRVPKNLPWITDDLSETKLTPSLQSTYNRLFGSNTNDVENMLLKKPNFEKTGCDRQRQQQQSIKKFLFQKNDKISTENDGEKVAQGVMTLSKQSPKCGSSAQQTKQPRYSIFDNGTGKELVSNAHPNMIMEDLSERKKEEIKLSVATCEPQQLVKPFFRIALGSTFITSDVTRKENTTTEAEQIDATGEPTPICEQNVNMEAYADDIFLAEEICEDNTSEGHEFQMEQVQEQVQESIKEIYSQPDEFCEEQFGSNTNVLIEDANLSKKQIPDFLDDSDSQDSVVYISKKTNRKKRVACSRHRWNPRKYRLKRLSQIHMMDSFETIVDLQTNETDQSSTIQSQDVCSPNNQSPKDDPVIDIQTESEKVESESELESGKGESESRYWLDSHKDKNYVPPDNSKSVKHPVAKRILTRQRKSRFSMDLIRYYLSESFDEF